MRWSDMMLWLRLHNPFFLRWFNEAHTHALQIDPALPEHEWEMMRGNAVLYYRDNVKAEDLYYRFARFAMTSYWHSAPAEQFDIMLGHDKEGNPVFRPRTFHPGRILDDYKGMIDKAGLVNEMRGKLVAAEQNVGQNGGTFHANDLVNVMPMKGRLGRVISISVGMRDMPYYKIELANAEGVFAGAYDETAENTVFCYARQLQRYQKPATETANAPP